MKTSKFFFLITFLLAISGMEQTKAQETQPDTVWVRWTHDISRLEFSNDDSKILTVGSGGIIIFDTQTGTQLKQLSGKGWYSPDGSMIIALQDTNVIVYNAETYEVINTIPLTFKGTYDVTLSPDGKTLIAAGLNVLRFIDFQTGSLLYTMNKFGDETRQIEITSYLFTKDSQYLILALWDPVKGEYGSMMYINTKTYLMDYKYNKKVGGLRISDNSDMLVFKSYEEPGKAVSIMNTQTHEIINSIPGNAGDVSSMSISPDGQYLAISSLDYKTKIYRIADFSIYKIFSPGRTFRSLDISNYKLFFLFSGDFLYDFVFKFIEDKISLKKLLDLTKGYYSEDNHILNIFSNLFWNFSKNMPKLEEANLNTYYGQNYG
ncbi:MAG: hypothetical protein V1779_01840 [bacterium]